MATSSTLKIEPLDVTLGAVVTGLKLPELDETTFDKLYATWLEYGLLVFPEQHLTKDEQLEFGRLFGEVDINMPLSNIVRPDGTRIDEEDGHGDDEMIRLLKGNEFWHCDATYRPVQTRGSVLSARVVPSDGGETEWADMAAAYDALDSGTKAQIADLSAYHSIFRSQSKLGHTVNEEYFGDESYRGRFANQDPPLRPLVKIHPETGRAALAIGRHAYSIAGMELDESERFLQDLVDFACQAPRIYRHAWSPGDAVVFDNRRLLHRMRPWDMIEERTLYISSIVGDPTTEFAAHA